MATTFKSEDHFWHFQDELLSDVYQKPNKGIYVLNTLITSLVNQCKFPDQNTMEMLKIMVLQHAGHYPKAWDWINQQDQSQLTYQALLLQYQLLDSCYEMFQKAKEKGHAELTSLSTVTYSVPSIHQDALLAYPKCSQCGYYHSLDNCQACSNECYRCCGHNHFTALYQRRPQTSSQGNRTKSLRDAGTSPQWGCNQPGSRCRTGCSPRYSH